METKFGLRGWAYFIDMMKTRLILEAEVKGQWCVCHARTQDEQKINIKINTL